MLHCLGFRQGVSKHGLFHRSVMIPLLLLKKIHNLNTARGKANASEEDEKHVMKTSLALIPSPPAMVLGLVLPLETSFKSLIGSLAFAGLKLHAEVRCASTRSGGKGRRGGPMSACGTVGRNCSVSKKLRDENNAKQELTDERKYQQRSPRSRSGQTIDHSEMTRRA